MNATDELKLMGSSVISLTETGLKIAVIGDKIVLLHLSPLGVAIGSAHLDSANARTLVDELQRALDTLEIATDEI